MLRSFSSIWFWSVRPLFQIAFLTNVLSQRPNIPQSILSATSTSSIDVSQWGPPSASFPATTCNITEFFTPQNLVLDITLCGVWYVFLALASFHQS